MRLLYSYERGYFMAIITITNELLKVSISTLGAELQSITDADGNERLWNGDPT